MGTPNSVANTGWLASLEARLGALWAWVASIWAFITGWIVAVYSTFVAWITPLVNWLIAIVKPLWEAYNSYIKPYLDWVIGAVRALDIALSLLRGEFEYAINRVFTIFLGKLVELENELRTVITNLGSVVAIFNKQLGERIIRQGLEFDLKITTMARELRDSLLATVDSVFRPLQQRLNEIIAVVSNIRRQFEERFKQITGLLASVIEKPKLLTKEAYSATGVKYGAELWRSVFEDRNPELTPEELEEEGLIPVDNIIGDIFVDMVRNAEDYAPLAAKAVKKVVAFGLAGHSIYGKEGIE